MEILSYNIPYRSRKDVFKIYYIADQHIGNTGFDREKAIEDRDKILNDPFAYWIQGGDAIDAVVLTDTKRFDPRAITCKRLDDIVMEEADGWLDIYKPIANRCIGILDGNHEDKIRQHYHIDIVRYLCKHMKTNYLGDVAFIKLLFTRKAGSVENKGTTTSFDIFAAHGNVAGRKGGGKVNRLEDLMANFDADIYMLAHGHKKITHSSTKLHLSSSGEIRLKQRKVVGFMTGSYLKTYQIGSKCYAEKGMFPPSDLGMIGVHIKPTTCGNNNVDRSEVWMEN